jgi:hypothetical protein
MEDKEGFPLCSEVKIVSPWLCHAFYFTPSLESNAFQLLLKQKIHYLRNELPALSDLDRIC